MNMYRYISFHTNYLVVEYLEQTRSKPMSEDYMEPITRIAIYLTAMLIHEICKIDQNSKSEFHKLPPSVKEYFDGISGAIKKY